MAGHPVEQSWTPKAGRRSLRYSPRFGSTALLQTEAAYSLAAAVE